MSVILCIWDGWGIGSKTDQKSNPMLKASKPNYDKLIAKHPVSYLKASGEAVGVPRGQMGNSEVGHTAIGSGRRIKQQLQSINEEIERGAIGGSQAFTNLLDYHSKAGAEGRCHVIGMLSDGGVHSHISHIKYMIKVLLSKNIKVCLHIISDGRDVAPKSVQRYISELKQGISANGLEISTMSGRFYAMDRDNRWERTNLYYKAISEGASERTFTSCEDMVNTFYQDEIYDEFFPPSIFEGYSGMKKEDSIFIMNFRSDRLKQIMDLISKSSCVGNIVSLFDYESRKDNVNCLLRKGEIEVNLGSIVANSGKTQMRLAETEKYAHVTFFFNGGKDDRYANERRILVPSPKVLRYDSAPEMSSEKITDTLVDAMKKKAEDLIVVNYANADMVGHTGNFSASIKAIEALDVCLARILEACDSCGYDLLLTSDHGNIEEMLSEKGDIKTSHTTNLVPMILYSPKKAVALRKEGELANIANTVLELLDIEPNDDMMPSLLARPV